jgi:hypothetical protein
VVSASNKGQSGKDRWPLIVGTVSTITGYDLTKGASQVTVTWDNGSKSEYVFNSDSIAVDLILVDNAPAGEIMILDFLSCYNSNLYLSRSQTSVA